MKKLRLLASFVLILLMFTMVSSVAAQSYSFNLTREIVNVYWNSDGTMALDYVFTFANDPARPRDRLYGCGHAEREF